MNLDFALEWLEEPGLIVEPLEDAVRVRIHPGLSKAQVQHACGELGDHGAMVLAAWESAVGLNGQTG